MISPESPLVTWAIVGLFKAFTMVLGGERFEIERLMRKNVALGLEVVAVRRQLAAAQAQSAKPKHRPGPLTQVLEIAGCNGNSRRWARASTI